MESCQFPNCSLTKIGGSINTKLGPFGPFASWLISARISQLIGKCYTKEAACESCQSCALVLEPERCSLHLASFSSANEMRVQSDEFLTHTEKTGGTTNAVTTSFCDEADGSIAGDNVPTTTNLSDGQGQIELATFLSRPVLIKTHVWAQTDSYTTTTTWDPWHLFFDSAPIKNKINNYAFVNCKLHLKFVINASPFYSGAMAFCYSPLMKLRGNTIITDSAGWELMEYSQQPKVWIYPQTNQGGELVLPFFYHKNWLDITSATDLQNMGTITPALYADLISANGATGQSVVVQVYAWAEDVTLHGPTMKLAVQSDEFVYKPSQIASAVSKAAQSLTRIPVIGPYMQATSVVTSKFASVAAMFGFTNVPNIDPVGYVKNSAYPNFASAEISVPIDKLSVDPKAEVTLDPRTVGLDGTDELEILHICKRETFIGTAILSSTDAVDALTLVSRVTPDLCTKVSGTDQPYHFTPMGYCARMFRYWRGDIVFRFKFVCTEFHKGRVRISFDPIENISTTVPNYTSIFNEVVDIGASNDVEVTVPYMQAVTFLKTSLDTANWNFAGTAVSPNGFCNGLLTMRVVNPLSGPIAPVAIPVMVFVRAGDNLEFAGPKPPVLNTEVISPYTVQSSDLVYAPTGTSLVAGTGCGKADPNRYLTHFGECIKSFRPLLHRNMATETIRFAAYTTTDTLATLASFSNRLPLYSGYDTNGISRALGVTAVASSFNFNFTKMNVHQLVSLLFVAGRGSVNWTYNLGQTNRLLSNVSLKAYHGVITRASCRVLNTETTSTPTYLEKFNYIYTQEPNSGIAMTDQRIQPAISAAFPYYSQYNFEFNTPSSRTLGSANDGTDLNNIVLQAIDAYPTAATYFVVSRFFSYGPDYNFFCFVNTPSLYIYTTPGATAA